MKGWKTWTGAAVILVSGGLAAFAEWNPEYKWLHTVSQTLMSAGAALGLVGIGHKVERARNDSTMNHGEDHA